LRRIFLGAVTARTVTGEVFQAAAGGGAGGGGSEVQEGSLEELQGFDFKRLAERRPDLQQELLGFRDHLLASSSTEESLKVALPNGPTDDTSTWPQTCGGGMTRLDW
jgi:hypothetical protein